VRWFGAALIALIAVGTWAGTLRPSAGALLLADADLLRPVFARLLSDPPVVRFDIVPDLNNGGYARIDVYAEHPVVQGMRLDQLRIHLAGARLDPAELHQGTLRILSVRDSELYGRFEFASVQEYLNREAAVEDVTLTTNGDVVTAAGTVRYNGIPLHVRMQGAFQVNGAPELFFHVQKVSVDAIPVPSVLVAHLERQINPIVDFRTWPVPFPIRAFQQTADGFVLSSAAHLP